MASEEVVAAKKALETCKANKDSEGEVKVLLWLAEARRDNGDADAALAAARRSSKLAKQLKDINGQAKAQLFIATAHFDAGYWELALRAAREGLQLLQEAELAKSKEAGALETLIAKAHQARGEEPPASATRFAALQVVGELGLALQDSDVKKFRNALDRLEDMGAYTDTDINRAFAPAFDKAGNGAELFLAKHMPDKPLPRSCDAQIDDIDNDVYCLRTFPCCFTHLQEGGAGKVTWTQTQGRILLCYPLVGGPNPSVSGGWAKEDIVVELATERMKVIIGGNSVKELSGELSASIWRKDSWWTVDEQEAMLLIMLYKRRPGAWEAVVNMGGQAIFKRTSFPWNEWQKVPNQDVSHLADEDELTPVQPGRPDAEEDEPVPSGGYRRSTPGGPFAPPNRAYMCSASDLCLGITTRQQGGYVDVEVHFERIAWKQLTATMPLEKVFGVDVWRNHVCIFIQGDKSNPILWGELAGEVVPHHTSWSISSSDCMRRRQETPELFSPCLLVRLCKVTHDIGSWPTIFKDCVQAKLMVNGWEKGCPRFEGLRDVPTARRTGHDAASPDFWSLVEGYCHETMKKSGHNTAPKPIAVM